MIFWFMFLGSTIWISSCLKNDVQLPDKELEGMIAGQAWEYKFANAYLYSSDFKYRIRFLSTKEPGEDPCAVPSTGNAHLSIVIPLEIASYNLQLPIIEETARFEIAGGNSVIATSGFLEIYHIDNSRVFGYIQAILDDDNSVEGSFEAVICN